MLSLSWLGRSSQLSVHRNDEPRSILEAVGDTSRGIQGLRGVACNTPAPSSEYAVELPTTVTIEGMIKAVYSDREAYYDGKGILRSPGEAYYDASGTLRAPGQVFIDYDGTLRSSNEVYYDSTTTLRRADEVFIDSKGNLRHGHG